MEVNKDSVRQAAIWYFVGLYETAEIVDQLSFIRFTEWRESCVHINPPRYRHHLSILLGWESKPTRFDHKNQVWISSLPT